MANSNRVRSKKDLSQPEIEKTLRSHGFSVASTHEVGDGFPDIAVGVLGLSVLIEVKNTLKDKASEPEVKFHRAWKGQIRVAHSAKEVVLGIRAHALWLINRLPAIVEECDRVLRLLDNSDKQEEPDEAL